MFALERNRILLVAYNGEASQKSWLTEEYH